MINSFSYGHILQKKETSTDILDFEKCHNTLKDYDECLLNNISKDTLEKNCHIFNSEKCQKLYSKGISTIPECQDHNFDNFLKVYQSLYYHIDKSMNSYCSKNNTNNSFSSLQKNVNGDKKSSFNPNDNTSKEDFKKQKLREYCWLFPLIFIFHDMEEIIGFGLFLKKNKTLLETKLPFFIKMYKDFSTEGFSFAVYEELILCLLFSVLAYITNFSVLWNLWLGAFIACTFHFIVHIGQSLLIRQYIPAVITSILCLPPSIYINYQCLCLILVKDGGNFTIISLVLGFVIVFINLLLIQQSIGWFTRKTGLTPLL